MELYSKYIGIIGQLEPMNLGFGKDAVHKRRLHGGNTRIGARAMFTFFS
jgi:hypothetical protein